MLAEPRVLIGVVHHGGEPFKFLHVYAEEQVDLPDPGELTMHATHEANARVNQRYCAIRSMEQKLFIALPASHRHHHKERFSARRANIDARCALSILSMMRTFRCSDFSCKVQGSLTSVEYSRRHQETRGYNEGAAVHWPRRVSVAPVLIVDDGAIDGDEGKQTGSDLPPETGDDSRVGGEGLVQADGDLEVDGNVRYSAGKCFPLEGTLPLASACFMYHDLPTCTAFLPFK